MTTNMFQAYVAWEDDGDIYWDQKHGSDRGPNRGRRVTNPVWDKLDLKVLWGRWKGNLLTMSFWNLCFSSPIWTNSARDIRPQCSESSAGLSSRLSFLPETQLPESFVDHPSSFHSYAGSNGLWRLSISYTETQYLTSLNIPCWINLDLQPTKLHSSLSRFSSSSRIFAFSHKI